MTFRGIALLVAIIAAPVHAQTVVPDFGSASYAIDNFGPGAPGISGTTTGQHSLSLGGGTGGSVTITPSSAPKLELTGTIGTSSPNFLRLSASYDYSARIEGSVTALSGLQGFITASSGPLTRSTIGYLTGIIHLSGTGNSDTSLSIQAGSENGSDFASWGCDGGSCRGPDGTVPTGVDVPYAFALSSTDFGFGCTPGVACYLTPGARPYSLISLNAAVGVGYLTDENGDSLGGSVYALLDPTFTLDPDFFTANNLNPGDYTASVTSIGTAAVPEPSSWALLVTGFGLAGGALRRRRTLLAA